MLFYSFQIFCNEVHYIHNLKVIKFLTKVSEYKRHKTSITTTSFVLLSTFFLHLFIYSFNKHPLVSAVRGSHFEWIRQIPLRRSLCSGGPTDEQMLRHE